MIKQVELVLADTVQRETLSGEREGQYHRSRQVPASGLYRIPFAFLIELFSCRHGCNFELRGERQMSARERTLLWVADIGACSPLHAL